MPSKTAVECTVWYKGLDGSVKLEIAKEDLDNARSKKARRRNQRASQANICKAFKQKYYQEFGEEITWWLKWSNLNVVFKGAQAYK